MFIIHVIIIFQKTKSTSSPSMSSLDGLDTKTAELQQRAKMLLEKRFDFSRLLYILIIDTWSFLAKTHFFHTFLMFSAWLWTKLLQQQSMPFFPLASPFMKVLLRHAHKSKFLSNHTNVFKLQCSQLFNFFVFPFYSFIFLLQLLIYY